MFSKKNGEVVGFKSNWKTEQSMATGSSQTDDIKLHEEGCQVNEYSDVGIQTEEEEVKISENPEYNEESLLAFLRRISPKVIQEIERQNRSRAFDGYSLLKDEESSGTKLLHTLRSSQLESDHVVSCIDWSCTGSVIAVSYAAKSHDNWCDHKGIICIWNINRSDFDANQPEKVIEISSCVLSLMFHPSNPAVFAAGTFSGELMVFDLSNSESVSPFATGDCNGGVTCLSWISTDKTSFSKIPNAIVASTNTGYILVFGLDLIKQVLPLKSGFMLQSEDIPRGIRTQMDEDVGVEISTISFSHEDPTLFVIGAEGGGLFLCSTTSERPAGKEFDNISFMKCVTSFLNPHTGRVLSAQFSTHHHNVILSSASDNQLRFNSILQPSKPVRTVYSEEMITCSELSPSRPMVVAVGLDSGQVALHDFGMKSGLPFLKLPSAEKPASITTIRFNKKDMALLAVGDKLGRVSVWHLPDNVVSPLSTELTSLLGLLKSTE